MHTMTTTLPAATEAQLAHIEKTLPTPGTKLGLLARRLRMAANVLQTGILDYGSSAIIAEVLGTQHTLKLNTSASILLTVQAGDGPAQTFQVDLGALLADTPRPETPITAFPAATA
jgi:hypothetical protein